METTFTTGVMGSGKSRKLIESMDEEKGLKMALAVSLDKQTGDFGMIESRDGQSIPAIYLNQKTDDDNILFLITALSLGVRNFYIDEVQFMSKELLDKIFDIMDMFDADVHFYGISTDFKGELFDSAKYLLMMLPEENVYELKMQCEVIGCHNLAEYNARIHNGKVLTTGEQFVEEKSIYISICGKCFHDNLE